MATTPWTAEALQARLRVELLLNSGREARKTTALKRLELLDIIRQVESNSMSTGKATEQLEMLIDQIHEVTSFPHTTPHRNSPDMSTRNG